MDKSKIIKQTNRGWVDLSNLVYNNNSINWTKSIGSSVNFKYDDIESTLYITDRADDIQYVYIKIPDYVDHHRIYVGQIKNGQLGAIIGKKTPDFKFDIGENVGSLVLTGKYRDEKYKYYLYYCKNDGHEGFIREDHMNKGHGCPICNQKSLGEMRVKDYLDNHSISYIQQYKFVDCVDKKKLHYDFYIPEFNACIEYDGIQHFQAVDFSGKGQDWAEQLFTNTKLHDCIKDNYCLTNNIPLCRVKYTQDISDTLDVFFNSLMCNEMQFD